MSGPVDRRFARGVFRYFGSASVGEQSPHVVAARHVCFSSALDRESWASRYAAGYKIAVFLRAPNAGSIQIDVFARVLPMRRVQRLDGASRVTTLCFTRYEASPPLSTQSEICKRPLTGASLSLHCGDGVPKSIQSDSQHRHPIASFRTSQIGCDALIAFQSKRALDSQDLRIRQETRIPRSRTTRAVPCSPITNDEFSDRAKWGLETDS